MEIISDAVVESVLELSPAIDRLEVAFGDLGRGKAATTIRTRAVSGGAMASTLAAAWPAGGVTGGKLYATKNGVFTFMVIVFDLDGVVLGVMEGDSLTRLRTAAGTGVAMRHLLGQATEVVTIIGVGRQCARHLELIASELEHVSEVRVVGRSSDGREIARRFAMELGLPVVASADASAAVDGADLVITLTSGSEPLFSAERLAEGALVCALGSTKAERVELGSDVVSRAHTVVVDSWAGSKVECGDLIAAEAAGAFVWDDAVELSALVADPALAAERTGHGVTLFESQGIALQDLVLGAMVIERLCRRG